MATHICLLRAVNVGGTGKLPMADLRALCEAAGFENVQTYIASGNVILDSSLSADRVKDILEQRLEAYGGKPVAVFVLSPEAMTAIRDANPFPGAAPHRTMVTFLGGPVPEDALHSIKGQADEKIQCGETVIYVHYGDGIGTSKLMIPAAKSGTARNMNTVAKLAEMSAARQD